MAFVSGPVNSAPIQSGKVRGKKEREMCLKNFRWLAVNTVLNLAFMFRLGTGTILITELHATMRYLPVPLPRCFPLTVLCLNNGLTGLAEMIWMLRTIGCFFTIRCVNTNPMPLFSAMWGPDAAGWAMSGELPEKPTGHG